MVRSTYQVCSVKSQNVAWMKGTPILPQLTPVESFPMPRMGMSSPGSGLPCKRFLPQLLAASAHLGPAKRDWFCDDEWLQEHLLPQEVGLAGTDVAWRPALTINWLSS